MQRDKLRLLAAVSSFALILGFAGTAVAGDNTKTKGNGTQAAANDDSQAAAAKNGSNAANAGGNITQTAVQIPIDISHSFNRAVQIDKSVHDNLTMLTTASLSSTVTGNSVSVGNGANNFGTIAAAVPVNVNTGHANGGAATSAGNNGAAENDAGDGGSIDQQGQADASADSHNVQKIALRTGAASADVMGVQGITSTAVNSGLNSSVNNQVTVNAAVGSVFSSGSIMRQH